ncbi:unnamed protein product, partial [Discosporangium mesarthrocarpum]
NSGEVTQGTEGLGARSSWTSTPRGQRYNFGRTSSACGSLGGSPQFGPSLVAGVVTSSVAGTGGHPPLHSSGTSSAANLPLPQLTRAAHEGLQFRDDSFLNISSSGSSLRSSSGTRKSGSSAGGVKDEPNPGEQAPLEASSFSLGPCEIPCLLEAGVNLQEATELDLSGTSRLSKDDSFLSLSGVSLASLGALSRSASQISREFLFDYRQGHSSNPLLSEESFEWRDPLAHLTPTPVPADQAAPPFNDRNEHAVFNGRGDQSKTNSTGLRDGSQANTGSPTGQAVRGRGDFRESSFEKTFVENREHHDLPGLLASMESTLIESTGQPPLSQSMSPLPSSHPLTTTAPLSSFWQDGKPPPPIATSPPLLPVGVNCEPPVEQTRAVMMPQSQQGLRLPVGASVDAPGEAHGNSNPAPNPVDFFPSAARILSERSQTSSSSGGHTTATSMSSTHQPAQSASSGQSYISGGVSTRGGGLAGRVIRTVVKPSGPNRSIFRSLSRRASMRAPSESKFFSGGGSTTTTN